jgi:hypothetical protein
MTHKRLKLFGLALYVASLPVVAYWFTTLNIQPAPIHAPVPAVKTIEQPRSPLVQAFESSVAQIGQ